jgi:hypothetical protein
MQLVFLDNYYSPYIALAIGGVDTKTELLPLLRQVFSIPDRINKLMLLKIYCSTFYLN